MMYYMATKIY